MPCDSGPSPSNWDMLRSKLDTATQVACELMRLLTKEQLSKASSLALWWMNEHKRLDEQREELARKVQAREALARKAIEKLTEEEREALGV